MYVLPWNSTRIGVPGFVYVDNGTQGYRMILVSRS